MKRMIHMGLIVLCLAATVQTFAQITIISSDVAAQLAINSTVQNRSDTLTKSLNIGSPGATSWNFSGLMNHGVTALKSVPVATSPYASSFPTATHTLESNITYSGIAGTLDLYVFLSASTLQNLGSKAATPPSPFLNILLEDLNSAPDTVYALPSTFGTSWSSRFTETLTIKLNGSVSGTPTVTVHKAFYQVDAYGKMTMPGGTAHDALRIRKVDSTNTGVRLTYIFLAKNGASVQASAASPAAGNSGVIDVSSISWSQPFNTAVASTPSHPSAFSLAQNYPNPFNPTTVVSFQLPVASDVRLSVYDLLGREVRVLVDERRDAGVHEVKFDGSNLASGVYFYRLQAGNFVQTRKLSLMR